MSPRTSAHRPTIPWGSQSLPHIPEGRKLQCLIFQVQEEDTGEFQRGWGGHQPCMCKKPPHPAAPASPHLPSGPSPEGHQGAAPQLLFTGRPQLS